MVIAGAGAGDVVPLASGATTLRGEELFSAHFTVGQLHGSYL